jgi:phage regulator Rha-like protein
VKENVIIQLLQMEKEILVDSRIVAKGIDIQHESFMKTIYTYQTELEEFGKLRFEVGPSGKTNQPQKYVLLNRNQAGVAITFSRNTKEIVRFKVDLFKAIDTMEKQLVETKQQLIDAKAIVKALVEEVHQLPWGIGRAEIGITEITCHRIMQFAERTEALLERGKLTEKQTQDISQALASIQEKADSIHGMLKKDLETNKHIDDLFFSFYDVVHPKLPDPNDKS